MAEPSPLPKRGEETQLHSAELYLNKYIYRGAAITRYRWPRSASEVEGEAVPGTTAASPQGIDLARCWDPQKVDKSYKEWVTWHQKPSLQHLYAG